MKGQFFLRESQHPSWNMQHSELRHLLGVKGTKLPPEALPPRLIQGIKVWVEPAGEPKLVPHRWGEPGKMRKLKSSTHRVMAECPACGEKMSAGRLHQHVCKAGVGALAAQAATSAKARGHALGPWVQKDRQRWLSQCVRCSAVVQVLNNPQPNEIYIGGTAVALNCLKLAKSTTVVEAA